MVGLFDVVFAYGIVSAMQLLVLYELTEDTVDISQRTLVLCRFSG